MASSTTLRIEEKVQAPPARVREPQRPPKRAWWKWLVALVVLAVIAVTAVIVARRTRPLTTTAPMAPAAFAPATRGDLVRTIRIGGVVAAVRFAGVSAPSLRGGGPGSGGPISVVRLAVAGAQVKKGDILAEFERQAQANRYEDRRAEYVSLTDQIAKRRAEIDIEREKRASELLKARTDLDSARLENQRNEVISRIDAEKNQQTLAEAEATLKMLQQTEKLRREAEESELKVLDIRRERERLEMENARMNYERLVIASPLAGMVVLTPIWKGNGMGTVQEGDQVRSGVQFLQVVDSSAMVVRARVNQLDAALLRPGLAGTVRLDAYPDLTFPGEIEAISTLASSPGWWSRYIKQFPLSIKVNGRDARLIPDISASMDVELERAAKAIQVPRGAVVRQAGSRDAGFVWVKRGDQLQPRAVTLGPKSDTHWAVTSGLEEGEMVALYPPAAEKPAPVQPEKPQRNAQKQEGKSGARS